MKDKKKAGKANNGDKAKLRKAAKPHEIGDTIFVRDFIVDCNVGVYAEEQGVTQKVRFTVEAGLRRMSSASMTTWPTCRPTPTSSISSWRWRAVGTSISSRLSPSASQNACLSDQRIRVVRIVLEKLERGPMRGVEIIRPATKDAAREFGRG